ncbi:MAG: DNA/RNA non-specific endonuclease [Bacteroidales bacterium]|nr:DNA/RNA non-specific endonuclease [Bacteroidales bacterium]
MRSSKFILAVFAALVATVSCELINPQDPEQEQGGTVVSENSLTLTNNPVGYAAGTQFLVVSAKAEWTLTLDCGQDVEPWANVSTDAGRPGTRKVVMAWEANDGEESRTCTITLAVGADKKSLAFTQGGKSSVNPRPVEGLNPDPVPAWLELPATNDPDLYFFTHDMQHGGTTKRNYSFYLDPQACLAIWVAYPLNNSLAGSGSRSNAWALDPKVPRKYQSVLSSGFSRSAINNDKVDRGHQLPSADRLTRGANEMTFYGTNMTPQKGELNQKAWATLEGKVRTWANQFDTLYVVTGCDIRGSYDYAYDNDGKDIPVPVGYFKALLGFKKGGTVGNTAKQGGYTAIGFYFNHEYYSDSEIMGQSMTIDELEEVMGIDFFPNLEAKLGADLYNKVESTGDSWWK